MDPMYIESGEPQYIKKGYLANLSTTSIALIIGTVVTVCVLGVVLGLIPVYIASASSSSSSSSSSYSSSSLEGTASISCTGCSATSGRVSGSISSITITSSTGSTQSTSSYDSAVKSYCMSDSTYLAAGLQSVAISWTTSSSGSTTTFYQIVTMTFSTTLTSSNSGTGPTGSDPSSLSAEFLGTNGNNNKFSIPSSLSSTTFGGSSIMLPTSASSITSSFLFGTINPSGIISGKTCTGTGSAPMSSCNSVNGPSGQVMQTPPPPPASGGGRFGPGANAPKLNDKDFIIYDVNN